MQYWFLGISFIIGCAILSGPKLMEVAAGPQGPIPQSKQEYRRENEEGKTGGMNQKSPAQKTGPQSRSGYNNGEKP